MLEMTLISAFTINISNQTFSIGWKYFFIFNFIFCTSLIAQKIPDSLYQYYKISNASSFHYYKKEYEKCVQTQLRAIKYSKPRFDEVILLIKASFYNNNFIEAENWLKYAAKEFGFSTSYFLNQDTTIHNFFQDSIKIKAELGKFYSNLERNYEIDMLNHYQINDIFFRNNLKKINYLCLNDYNSYRFALIYDSIYAFPFIIGLINKYNFPDTRDIGYLGNSRFHFLIRHYNIEKSCFDSALFSGKISPENYASIIDYHFNWNFEVLGTPEYKGGPLKPKQDFGLNLKKITNDTFQIVLPDEYELVDQRRDEIGLPPLWQIALIKGYKLPDEYALWLNKKQQLNGK